MLNQDNTLNIIRKGFEFPLSITSFLLDENAKTATYEYAGMNGAMHERVLNYRVMTISGTFAVASNNAQGQLTPEQYIKKLISLNDNKPGLLVHPLLGTFMCIIHSLKVKQLGDEVEASENNNPIPNFSFDVEFWEFSFSGWNKNLDRLYPAIKIRPINDYYEIRLKYKTCDELYQALVDGLIVYGTDPILNSEWLLYDTAIRNCAYNKYIGRPTGTPSKKTITNTKKKRHVVKPGETIPQICQQYIVTCQQVCDANKGQVVNNNPTNNKFNGAMSIKPGDSIIIPSIDMSSTTNKNLGFSTISNP